MEKHKITCLIIYALIVMVVGCTSPFFKTTTKIEDVSENENSEEITEETALLSPAKSYEDQETLLQEMLDNYDDALIAYQEGNLGLAETKLEDAFVLSMQVNLEEIEDESLVERFKDAYSSIGQEFGKILGESAIIAEEDPMAWLDELGAEQFKSGQWTDEELKKIVLKIATKIDVPIEFNQKVRNAIYYFQNGGREDFSKWLKRSGRYLPMITEIFDEEGIPLDMAYLSMIESGFNPKAYSRARAVGLWQFIYSTGKIYGLNRNQWIDERKDPLKATKAAAKHLNDLYKISDDWNIVMAAYNSGPRRITSQLKETENIEFWDMQLPRETRNYVPSYMAAVCIAKAPEIFGFDDIEIAPPLEFDIVEVHPYTSLKTASKCAGVDIQELKDLNPELLRDRVPQGKEKYSLRIPRNKKDEFLAEYVKMPVEKYEPPKVTSVRVRRGDTFSGIARRHGVSVNRLRAANSHIRNINKLRIGQRISIPGSTSRSSYSSTSKAAPVSLENTQHYTVQRNDTLGIIAERYKTNVRTLQALNNMGRRTTIYVGQILLVPQRSGSEETQKQKIVQTDSGRIIYIVQKNDTLYEIAQKYGVDYRKIKEINKIKDHRKIMPGQKIIIDK